MVYNGTGRALQTSSGGLRRFGRCLRFVGHDRLQRSGLQRLVVLFLNGRNYVILVVIDVVVVIVIVVIIVLQLLLLLLLKRLWLLLLLLLLLKRLLLLLQVVRDGPVASSPFAVPVRGGAYFHVHYAHGNERHDVEEYGVCHGERVPVHFGRDGQLA